MCVFNVRRVDASNRFVWWWVLRRSREGAIIRFLLFSSSPCFLPKVTANPVKHPSQHVC